MVISSDMLRRIPFFLRRITACLLRISTLSRFLIIKRDSYRIRFFPTSKIAHIAWNFPDPTREEEVVGQYLRPGDTVVDVGANIGSVALLAASRVGSSGRVLAIEPHPKTYQYLTHNLGINDFTHLQSFNYAVGDHAGTIHFTDLKSDVINRIDDSGSVEVELISLDEMLTNNQVSRVDLLKIDVEGFEKWVLLGAEHILDQTECVYIETSAPNLQKYGVTPADIFAILKAHTFQLYYVVGQPHANALAIRNPEAFALRAPGIGLTPVDDH